MSLFAKVGKKFEATKQAFTDGVDAEYVCRSCEASLTEDSKYCPHCGEKTVEPVDET